MSIQVDVLNTPPVENIDEPMKYKEDERPCRIVNQSFILF